jgi:hypothetical protein
MMTDALVHEVFGSLATYGYGPVGEFDGWLGTE